MHTCIQNILIGKDKDHYTYISDFNNTVFMDVETKEWWMRTVFEIQHQGFKGYPYNAEHEGVVEVRDTLYHNVVVAVW